VTAATAEEQLQASALALGQNWEIKQNRISAALPICNGLFPGSLIRKKTVSLRATSICFHGPIMLFAALTLSQEKWEKNTQPGISLLI
jgi:hypothetical protein